MEADRKFDIWSAPEILVINLKRFTCDDRYRTKITKEIQFPIKGLDMTS